MLNLGTPWNTHDLHFPGFLRTIILHPGGTIGVILKSNVPQIMLYVDSMGLIIFGCGIFKVISAWYSSQSHKCIGNPSSTLLSLVKKWFFQVPIAYSSAFRWCVCAGTSCKSTFSFSINSRSNFETLFSNIFIWGVNTWLTIIPCSYLYFSGIAYFVWFCMSHVKITFESQS